MRIAMWSGPRNLSTAMMYAFGNRSDCAVWDEPFYAPYLLATGIDHPMRTETLAAWPNRVEDVITKLTARIPEGKSVFYQKHMTHHMLPDYDLGWTVSCLNVFLIRHPARVIASYNAKRNAPTPQDIGFQRQAELHGEIAAITGTNPPVFDADDIRANPRGALTAICALAGINFDPGMLRWPAGARHEDGPWAPHWYGSVHQSTGFAGPDGPLPDIPKNQSDLLSGAMTSYRSLYEGREIF